MCKVKENLPLPPEETGEVIPPDYQAYLDADDDYQEWLDMLDSQNGECNEH